MNVHRIIQKYKQAFLGVAVLVSLSFFAEAQQWPSELWHDGKIVLLEGDTLRGLVKYDLEQNLVQYAIHEQTAEVYTARKVLFFEIFDETVRKYRRFFALPYAASAGYRTPVFFELLEEGKMTLLAREFLEYKTISSPYFVGSYSRLVMDYNYFFLKENGDIEQFLGNRNDLLDLMGKKSAEVEKFIRDNRLHFDEKQDLTRIVSYYNSLWRS